MTITKTSKALMACAAVVALSAVSAPAFAARD